VPRADRVASDAVNVHVAGMVAARVQVAAVAALVAAAVPGDAAQRHHQQPYEAQQERKEIEVHPWDPCPGASRASGTTRVRRKKLRSYSGSGRRAGDCPPER